ncbi:MAG: sulfite exporter TauE/SafE family protein [Chloroflexaceae bacterium]
MTILQAVALFVAALLAGALNAVAGGGSLISFPTLLFVGVPSISANATNKVALWPGLFAGASAYRRELLQQRRSVVLLSVVSLAGGLSGALLLLATPERTFDQLVPYLLLTATLLFTFSKPITNRVLAYAERSQGEQSKLAAVGAPLLQFLVSVYGGFFGAGLGIMILAVLAVVGMEDIHMMNALKTVLAGLVGSLAVITFIFAGIVVWPMALTMIGGAIIGGYAGGAIARRFDARVIRRFVALVGFSVTIVVFVRQYML